MLAWQDVVKLFLGHMNWRPYAMDSLTLPGTLEALAPIRTYVEAAAVQAGLDKKRVYRLTLAVDEIVSNSIIHGYEETGLTGNVIIRADLQPDDLTVYVEDQALPYDPLGKEAPTNLGASLEDRDIGGLGVFLAVKNVDEFRYEYSNGKNRNIFVMKLKQKVS
jgi:serine/threonine-protein kinase RsbW